MGEETENRERELEIEDGGGGERGLRGTVQDGSYLCIFFVELDLLPFSIRLLFWWRRKTMLGREDGET